MIFEYFASEFTTRFCNYSQYYAYAACAAPLQLNTEQEVLAVVVQAAHLRSHIEFASPSPVEIQNISFYFAAASAAALQSG